MSTPQWPHTQGEVTPIDSLSCDRSQWSMVKTAQKQSQQSSGSTVRLQVEWCYLGVATYAWSQRPMAQNQLSQQSNSWKELVNTFTCGHRRDQGAHIGVSPPPPPPLPSPTWKLKDNTLSQHYLDSLATRLLCMVESVVNCRAQESGQLPSPCARVRYQDY